MTISRFITGSIWVVSVLAVNITVPAQKKRETLPPQWEHAVTYGCESQPFQGGKSNLQEMGEYGWELAGVSKDSTGNSTCYFKRPKREGGYPEPPKQAEPTATAPKCSLTVVQAPLVRGLRLGMSLQELLALFPASRYNANINQQINQAEKIPADGLTRLGFSLSQYPEAGDSFAGLRSVDLTMFDRKVVSFSVSYDSDSQAAWTLKSLIPKLSKAYNLPDYENWAKVDDGCEPATLKCGDLTIEAYARSPRLTVTDTSYIKEIERRAAAVAQKKQAEFKP